MQNSSFKTKFAPTIVLVVICLVISAALAITNGATAPQIAKINKEQADATRASVLTEADAFHQYEGQLNDGIAEVYFADNKTGGVITSVASSYGGDITVMVGIDAEGAITGVQVTAHSDTPGLGTKAMTPEYLAGYNGLSELSAAAVKDSQDVDYIVGATISSNGIYTAVKNALQQFNDCGGVQ